MPSYLGYYEGCAENREEKFKRAVHSFLEQDYENKELIIISDGCNKTIEICSKNYIGNPKIILVILKKQRLFSGYVRQKGIDNCSGDIICYLDTDDIFGKGHLSAINNAFELHNPDWIYYSDILRFTPTDKNIRNVELEHGLVGTSSIAHRKLKKASWNMCDGYGHDWTFIQKLIKNYPNHKKVYGCNYIVCHVPNLLES